VIRPREREAEVKLLYFIVNIVKVKVSISLVPEYTIVVVICLSIIRTAEVTNK